MPFTPFHIGAAFLVKPVLNRCLSVITFGIAQVAMDIEPGVRILFGADVVHGPTHSILGALIVAGLVLWIAPGVCNYLQEKWSKEVIYYRKSWHVRSGGVSKGAVVVGAFFGTLSHVVLDSLIHRDIHPLSPFSQANPFMGLITHDAVYQACAIAGVLGCAVWSIINWARASQGKA